MSNIKVAVRCRPLFEQERPATGLDIQGRRILLDSKTYDPDYTFPPTSTQDDVFAACRPILQCVKDGLNGTLMVYGQTGTGKTYTMLGTDGADNGLVHKVIAHMLDHVQQKTLDGSQCALTLSMVEIYNERLTDMLSEKGEEEVSLIAGVPRATHKVTLGRLSDANEAVRRGLAVRHTAATLMNERSSRSHVVFMVDLEELNVFTEETEVAHLFMVDLAGSESIKKSQATGSTAGEAGKINKSLLALKSVFLALSNTNEATRPAHVPYRDSRLTELLQDSIGGTARTLMIACISAVGRDIEETKSTLMYAVKARSIRNAANTEKEKLLIRLRSTEVENQRLRNRLQERVNERGGYYITKEEHDRYDVMEAESKELRECVEKLIKDTQASDARKHISESQTKILQGLVDDKEEELQAFKNMYHEALQRFERNASALQRIVQGAVGDVHQAAQGSAVQRHERLVHWKTQLLALLSAPAPDAPVSIAVAPAAVMVPMPTLAAPHEVDNEEANSVHVSPQKPLRSTSTRGSLASQFGASSNTGPSSRTASPGRKGGRSAGGGGPRRVQRERDRDLTVLCLSKALEVDTETPPAQATATESGSGSASPLTADSANAGAVSVSPLFLQEADNTCHSVVQRVNGVFVDLMQALITACERCDEATRRAAEVHERQTDSVCEQLRSSVDECIRRLQKAGQTARHDTADAQDELRGRLRVLGAPYLPCEGHENACRGPCEVGSLQAMVREACAATARSSEAFFPAPDVAEELKGSLDRVVVNYQCTLSSMYASALSPLSAVSAASLQQQQAYQAMLASTEQQQQLSHAAAAAACAEGREPSGAVGGGTLWTAALAAPVAASASPQLVDGATWSNGGGAVPPLAPSSQNAIVNVHGASNPPGTGPSSPPSSSMVGNNSHSPSGPSLALPPMRPLHSASRTASYGRAGSAAMGGMPAAVATGQENRLTTGSRLSNANVNTGVGANSARSSSLRAQRPSSTNASPRPLQKRARSAYSDNNGSTCGTSSAPESARRTPSSRLERRR